MIYIEPELSILVLDFKKPNETRLCLESIKKHIKVSYKVIYLHNGNSEDYPYQYFKEGLIDYFIQTKDNEGLGLGTRNTFALSFSPYSISLQNDQFIFRDFNTDEFEYLKKLLGATIDGKMIVSISLAGPVCGQGIYSERCHIIQTDTYKQMEFSKSLGYHGAGPYHDGVWRERQIQDIYAKHNAIHFTEHSPLVVDNGIYAVRDMREGGLWIHRTDNKKLWNIIPPIILNSSYPKFSDNEKTLAFNWPDGRIPETEIPYSFNCWVSDDNKYINEQRINAKKT
jgi:hypothetical protein